MRLRIDIGRRAGVPVSCGMRILGLLTVVSLLGVSLPASAAQRYPEAGTPVDLLRSPTDPLAYLASRSRVRDLVAAGRHAEAESDAEALVAQYPRDGENWLLLARVKAGVKKPGESAGAYERAATLLGGGIPYLATINAAMQHVAAGDTLSALELLRHDVFADRTLFRANLFGYEAFAPLRANPEFLRIAGRVDTTGWGRVEGWRRDIDFLRDEIRRVNPDFHDAPLPAEFTRRYEALRQGVATMSDEEITVGLNRMLAALRQAHTQLLSSRGRLPVNHLPVQFHLFPEGLFIVDAAPEHRALIGSRVVSIGRTPAAEALRRVNEIQSVDGDMHYLFMGPWIMRTAQVLKGLGIVDSVASVPLVIEQAGRERAVQLPTGTHEGYLALPPVASSTSRIPAAPAGRRNWEHQLPALRTLYVHLGQVGNDPTETLPQFGRRLRTVLATGGMKHVILDVRRNGGGASNLYIELLRTLVGFSAVPGNRLYVLIGRNTYSAAANLVTDVERLAEPTFIGEPTSQCCMLHGDPSGVQLPYSGLAGTLTAVHWNLSYSPFDGRTAIVPHVPVATTAADYFAGRDRVLEVAFRLIETGAAR